MRHPALISTKWKSYCSARFYFRQCIAPGLQPCDADSFSDANPFSDAYPSADNGAHANGGCSTACAGAARLLQRAD